MLVKRMPASKVASIIGEEPPSPQPPRAPPAPLPPPPFSPAPLFSDSLMRLFKAKPPPGARAPAPPPPHPVNAQSFAGHQATQTHAIILGSSMHDNDFEDRRVVNGWTMNHIVAALVAALLAAAIFRYNPHLTVAVRERFSGRTSLPRPAKMVRPRQREYDRVAVEPVPLPVAPPRADRKDLRGNRSTPRPLGSSRAADTEEDSCPSHSRRSEAARPRTECSQERRVPFTAGMQVRVVGLRNATQHNGNEGVLIAPMPKTTQHGDRWNIRMLTGELLALKEGNMEPCETTPSVVAMIEALERAGEYDKAALLRSVLPDTNA